MDVTYFIGNGFDLSLGLRTGYRSFLREYLKKPVKAARPNDPNAAAGLTAVQARAIRRGKRMICEHLRKGCINWSDMEAALGESETTKLVWRPQTTTELDLDAAQSLLKLIEALEDHDDVADAYANVDVPDDVAAELSAE